MTRRNFINNTIHTLTVLSLLIASLLISGCGFHFKNAKDYPESLHVLYIEQPATYSNQLISGLTLYLKSMNVTLASDSTQAPITLRVSNINFSSNNAALSSGSNAITITYKLQATVQLLNKHHAAITVPKVVAVTEQITQNSTIINTSANNELMHRELNREIIANINAWLLSDATQSAIAKKAGNTNAA